MKKAIRKPLDAFAISLMTILCVIWGLQHVAVKFAAPGMSPILQTGLCSAAAAILVFGLIWKRDKSFSLRAETFWPGICAGFLFAAEFLCASIGIKNTSASHIAIFLYTAPIFAVLGLHYLVPGERLKIIQWAGVLTAFMGVGLAFSSSFTSHFKNWNDELMGDILGLIAGVFWGATTVLIRRSTLSEAPPTTTLLYQLSGSTLILLPIAIATGQAETTLMTSTLWLSLVFQAVVIFFLSFLAWFWLLRCYLASRISVFSFLTPIFGVVFGVLLLNDPIDLRFGTGAVLVLVGVGIVNYRRPQIKDSHYPA